MNQRKYFFTAIGALTLLGCSSLLALNAPGVVTLSLASATYHFDHNRDLKTTQMPNAAVSYNFNDHWGVEGSVGLINTTTNEDKDDNNDSDSSHDEGIHGFLYTIDGIYRFPTLNLFQPYVLAGIGILGLKPNGPDSVQSGNINAGIGTQLFLNRTIALRGEIRDIYATTGSYKNDYNINLGVSFLLGGP